MSSRLAYQLLAPSTSPTFRSKTVEAHRAQIMERLGLHDVAGLVRFAVRMGLVRPEE